MKKLLKNMRKRMKKLFFKGLEIFNGISNNGLVKIMLSPLTKTLAKLSDLSPTLFGNLKSVLIGMYIGIYSYMIAMCGIGIATGAISVGSAVILLLMGPFALLAFPMTVVHLIMLSFVLSAVTGMLDIVIAYYNVSRLAPDLLETAKIVKINGRRYVDLGGSSVDIETGEFN